MTKKELGKMPESKNTKRNSKSVKRLESEDVTPAKNNKESMKRMITLSSNDATITLSPNL